MKAKNNMIYYKKNIFQNGDKTVDGVVATIVPFSATPKKEINISAQNDQSNFTIDNNLPSIISGEKGLMALQTSHDGIQKYSNISKNAQLIDYSSKKKNSFDGIDLSYGGDIEELLQFYSYLMSRDLIDEDISSTQITNGLVNLLVPEILAYRETGQKSSQFVKLANDFKLQMYEVVSTAEGKFYGQNKSNAYNTQLMDRIKGYQEDLKDFVNLYSMDGNEAMSYMSDKLTKAKASLYDYQNTESPYTTSRTSKNAKDRLLNNPWYLSYVNSVSSSHPELYEQLNMSATVPYITDMEETVIRRLLEHNSELSKQKSLIQDEYGWEKMNEIFDAKQANGASLNDLLDLTWELNKTAVDDQVEDSIAQTSPVTINFDTYLDSGISYTTPKSSSIDSKSASDIIVTEGQKAPEGTTQANMRFDKLTKKMVPIDYEEDKKLPRLEGAVHSLTEKEWDNIQKSRYSEIRNKNLEKLYK